MLITVLLSLSPAEEVLANFWLIPFKEVAAELDILLKPLLRLLPILLDKLAKLEVSRPNKLVLTLFAKADALADTELKKLFHDCKAGFKTCRPSELEIFPPTDCIELFRVETDEAIFLNAVPNGHGSLPATVSNIADKLLSLLLAL